MTLTIPTSDASQQHLVDGWRTIRTVTIRMLQSGSEPHAMLKRRQSVEDELILNVHAKHKVPELRLHTTLTMTAMDMVIQTTGRKHAQTQVSSGLITIKTATTLSTVTPKEQSASLELAVPHFCLHLASVPSWTATKTEFAMVETFVQARTTRST